MSTAAIKQANKVLSEMQKDFEKNGLTEKTVSDLREIRLHYRDVVVDPLLTKMCRLSADHIENNSSFDFDISDPEEEEEFNEVPFTYLLEIMKDPENKYNRDEIQAFKALIIAERD